MLRTLDLFSGIGGFALGLEATGFFRTTCFVELEPYCRLVLKSHWPRTPILGDIKNVTRPDLPDPDPDGALHAQAQGKLGTDVADSKRTRTGVEEHQSSGQGRKRPNSLQSKILRQEDRTGGSKGSSTSGANVADTDRDDGGRGSCTQPQGREARMEHGGSGERCTKPDTDPNVADTTGVQRKRSGAKRSRQGRSEEASGGYRSSRAAANYWEIEPQVGRLVDGLPDRVPQLRALGNSIIPQIAEEIGYAIRAAEAGEQKVECNNGPENREW